MRRLTLRRWFFYAGTSGLLLLAISLMFWERPHPQATVWMAAEVIVAELLQARLVRGEGLSFTASISLAGLWFFGPTTAMLAAMLGIAAVGLWRQRDWLAMVFNIGQVGLRIAGAYWAFHWFRYLGITPLGVFLSALIYAGLNIMVMSVAFALDRHEPVGAVWRNHLQGSWLPWLDRIALALVFMALLARFGIDAFPFIAAMVLLASLTSRTLAHRAQERAVDRLLSMAGARAPYRLRRAQRMIRLAEAVAKELPLDELVLRHVRHGVLLQDIGLDPELERRLERPGPLSPQDRRALLAYPENSGRLIGEIGALAPVADAVRHAYERYDGFGYPAGLLGEAIPLSSRVMAVVRAFESMTSGRAYRPARSVEEALSELQREAGRQFDPMVVQACVRAVEQESHLAGPDDVEGALEQLRLFLTGKRQSLELSYSSTLVGLSSLAQSLGESLSLDATLNRVTSLVGRLTGWPNVIHMVEDDGEILTCRAHWGFPAPMPENCCPPAGRGLAAEASWARQPLYSADIVAEMRETNAEAAAFFGQAGIKAALAVPMIARGRVIGVLCVFSRQSRPFSPDQTNLLYAVAGEAALALENARLFTEARRRYTDLVEMQAFTSTLLQESNSAIVAWDRDGRVRHFNHAARAMVRENGLLSSDEAIEGRLWSELSGDERIVRPVMRVLETGEALDIYGARVSGGPEVRVLDIHISALRDGDRVIGAVCMAHDVTEHSRMQEHLKQVEKLAAVGELAAGAAHEIRNPLTAIRGFIQLLGGREAMSETDREYVDIMMGEIDRIDCLLEDLLTLARPTSPNRRPVHLHQLLEEVALLVRAKEVGRGVRIHWEWTVDQALAEVDPRQMKQVFLNIVQNAAEAMHGKGEIVLTTRLSPQGELVISCQDSGPGIPADILPRIFDPFFTTKDTGTGLGLAVSFRIVESHGGRIQVESGDGLGTLFRVILPAGGMVRERADGHRAAGLFGGSPREAVLLAAEQTPGYPEAGAGGSAPAPETVQASEGKAAPEGES